MSVDEIDEVDVWFLQVHRATRGGRHDVAKLSGSAVAATGEAGATPTLATPQLGLCDLER